MRISTLFSKTSKQNPTDEISKNAQLLIRAGYVEKVAAGIYSFLPLGVRVINKISQIVREEMNAIGGQEILMPVLHPKENWEKTGRWASLDVLFKVKGQAGEFALGPTHEEIVVPLAQRFISSYSDLPKYVYQIQTKFRDEPRSKSGLLRGREFLMKDLYSLHTSEADLDEYYDKARAAYKKVFKRMGLESIEAEASGGTFSKYSHEYQVICENGEDEIIYCPGGDYAQNKEIAVAVEGKQCDLGHGPLKRVKTIEVGNIFKLKTKYSEPFGLKFTDKDGSQKLVVMGCYGIGISRLMGTIVEVMADEKGIIWPKTVSPYEAHLVHIEDKQSESWAKQTYEKLTHAGVDVLWDDREDVSAGEKFADSDLIGVPVRLVISKKVGEGKVEWKGRDKKEPEIMNLEQAISRLTK